MYIWGFSYHAHYVPDCAGSGAVMQPSGTPSTSSASCCPYVSGMLWLPHILQQRMPFTVVHQRVTTYMWFLASGTASLQPKLLHNTIPNLSNPKEQSTANLEMPTFTQKVRHHRCENAATHTRTPPPILLISER